ncbi:Winged helix-turn-helix transcription repressor DNA-binding [Penicillium bovifimosum]|uniref:Forkhead box protein O n=1 Tax=Penicillium bovifimosum TaxID=126998 RepID=A0A9W9GW36_9EURO|nr:Winged helix-turn-helix transcription repressor DNA-binding [Penicillium bovifimosum]KAJ5131008.1 Winged helix-turn-helix transcription repressor DNA-binding [Penicillium bovifimosum]
MDYSYDSRHFNSMQISPDQGDPKPHTPSQSESVPLPMDLPDTVPFSVHDWARWKSQPAFYSSPRQYAGYGSPRDSDAEPRSWNQLPQEFMGEPTGYPDQYRPHLAIPMADTSEALPSHSECQCHPGWPVMDSGHEFKSQTYDFATHLDPIQPLQSSPPSPLSEISSYHSPQSLAAASPSMTAHSTDRLSPRLSTAEQKQERSGHLPYSALIYNALKAAPGNKLPLQGIYNWFQENTDKGADPSEKGWQNSIRHNLSMNAGFEAVKEEPKPGEKPVNLWRLTPEAIRKGCIESTTRYRKLQNQRKAQYAANRAPQRQSTGKGNHTMKVVKSRSANSPHGERNDAFHQQIMTEEYGPTSLPSMQQYMQRPMGTVVGCTSMVPDTNAVFLDPPAPTFAMGNGLPGWYPTESGSNRVQDQPEYMIHGQYNHER